MPLSALYPSVEFAAQRRAMTDCQIRTYDVTDQPLIARFLETPREIFLPERLATVAYSDMALDVGRGAKGETRRLLPPMVLARMIQAAQVGPTDKILDIGGGGGYGAALLAGLAASTLAVETDEAFTERAQAGFAQLGLANAEARTGSLEETTGLFDVILVNGAVEVTPDGLLSALTEGGRLVAIQKEASDTTGFAARAVVWERSQNRFGRRPLFNAAAPVLPGFAFKQAFAF